MYIDLQLVITRNTKAIHHSLHSGQFEVCKLQRYQIHILFKGFDSKASNAHVVNVMTLIKIATYSLGELS